MNSSTLWCAAAGVWGGALAFLLTALVAFWREIRHRRRRKYVPVRWDR